MPSNRINRIEEEVKRTLSKIITTEVKDDRLSPLTAVTSVEITPDLKFAKVFISVPEDDKQRKKTIDALNHAGSFIRTRLSKSIDIRRAPQLAFELDTSVDYSLKIAKLLNEVKAEDEKTREELSETDKED